MKNLLIILLCLIALYSCTDDDCPIEPNPCSEFPDNFEIITSTAKRGWCNGDAQVSPGEYQTYFFDTFSSRPALRIQFSTNYNYDSLRWKIGNDPTIYREKEIKIDFLSPFGDIIITCIGWRKVNLECFGNQDNGIDTIQRKISIFHLDDAPIFGTFKGANLGTNDSFNVTLGRDTLYDNNIGEYYENYFSGLPRGSTNKVREVFYSWLSCVGATSKGATTQDGLAICYIEALINRNNHDNIEIRWRNIDNQITQTFKGKRIK